MSLSSACRVGVYLGLGGAFILKYEAVPPLQTGVSSDGIYADWLSGVADSLVLMVTEESSIAWQHAIEAQS